MSSPALLVPAVPSVSGAWPVAAGGLGASRASRRVLVRPDEVTDLIVRSVLHRLFDEPPTERTRAAAGRLVASQWARFAEQPAGSRLLRRADPGELQARYDGVLALVDRWFTLEDPARLAPSRRTVWLHDDIDGREVRARVDRVDVAPDGRVRLVGYSTGSAPTCPRYDEGVARLVAAAVVVRRVHGCSPVRTQLVCLGSGSLVIDDLDGHDLRAAERRLVALGRARTVAA